MKNNVFDYNVTTVRVRGDLMKFARERGVNISKTLENALVEVARRNGNTALVSEYEKEDLRNDDFDIRQFGVEPVKFIREKQGGNLITINEYLENAIQTAVRMKKYETVNGVSVVHDDVELMPDLVLRRKVKALRRFLKILPDNYTKFEDWMAGIALKRKAAWDAEEEMRKRLDEEEKEVQSNGQA